MFSLSDYYEVIETNRNSYFKLFKAVDREIFYTNASENTWSAELIFRHLLTNLNWFKNIIPNIDYKDTKLGIDLGKIIEDRISLEELEKEFHRISTVVKEGIERMTSEEQEEELVFDFGKKKRKQVIADLLFHENNHLGQIIWIFKRTTGWTDQNIDDKLERPMY